MGRARGQGGDWDGDTGLAENDPAGLSRQGGLHRIFRRVRSALSLLPQRRVGGGGGPRRLERQGTDRVFEKTAGPAGWGVRHRRRAPAPTGAGGAAEPDQKSGLSGEAGHQRQPPGPAAPPDGGRAGGLCGHGHQKQPGAVWGDGGTVRPGPGSLPGERLLPPLRGGGL